MNEKDWHSVLPLVQSILNHSFRPTLGNRAPITAFSGLPSDNPLRTLMSDTSAEPVTIDFIRAQQLIKIDRLAGKLDKMHRDVAQRKTKHRQAAIERHNKRTHVRATNFQVGDFVLVAKRSQKDGHKLRVTWTRPRRVTRAVSDLIFECQDLIANVHNLFHANKLKFYADSCLDVSEELLDTVNHNDPHLE